MSSILNQNGAAKKFDTFTMASISIAIN